MDLRALMLFLGLCSSDVKACPSSAFQCRNEKCVVLTYVCDGDDDCGDGSDEEKCSASAPACSQHEFRCNNFNCIPALWTCDGDPDCMDKSDESMELCGQTTEPQNPRCSEGTFQCGSGECIHMNWKCDGDADCRDKSDEANCLSLAEVRLVGGLSPCSGRLEQQRQWDWEPVKDQNLDWNLTAADQVCRRISCGSVVSLRRTLDQEPPEDLGTKNDSRDEGTPEPPPFRVEITCSDSVRLENQTHLCSGRLQVKRNQVWSSVCSDGFDLQDAEVVCRELDCGSPSGFEEELYGEAPEWIPEFRCGGHESVLLHCEHLDRDTCSPGTTVTLTCSAPDHVRLVGTSSTCAGELQMKFNGEWRPGVDWDWFQYRNWTSAAAAAAVVCSQLGCGSIVKPYLENFGSDRPVWRIQSSCFQSAVSLQDCLVLTDEAKYPLSLQLICSDLLVQPNISVSPSHDQVQQQKVPVLLGSNFSIICSTRPQYPGGSFQLVFTSSSTTLDYVLPAVTHSAVFLFPAAEGLHRGTYTCIYHLNVFSHNFSSTSRSIHLIPSGLLIELIIRCVVHLLVMVLLISVTCFYSRKYSVKTRSRNEETNVVVELQ